MKLPPTADLPIELQGIQQRWLDLRRDAQDELYAKEFAEPFARLFARLELFGSPKHLPRPEALISLLGFSWQPVALMAAWCRPTSMLVIGTEESLGKKVAGEGVVSLIARVAGLDRDSIATETVGDPGEADIYRAVRDFLARGVSPRRVFIDPTGGKKSMSASAALAGFLAGAPLVYVDYREYHGPNRIPVAGTEYPRLLANPLEVLGDLELRDIFAAFNRSDFDEAARLAGRLSARLYEPREASALRRLAEGYSDWDRFNFASALEKLEAANEDISRFAAMGNWTWAEQVQETLQRNLSAVRTLRMIDPKPASIGEGLPLVIWYLATADRMLAVGKLSIAVLLTYAAMERFTGLCLRVDFGLDGDNPDYSLVCNAIDWERFDQAGKKLVGKKYQRRDLEGHLMFANSVQLLAALSPDRLDIQDLGKLCSLSATRNRCEYEHGFLPKLPLQVDVQDQRSAVGQIVGRCCGAERLQELLAQFTFPRFHVV